MLIYAERKMSDSFVSLEQSTFSEACNSEKKDQVETLKM